MAFVWFVHGTGFDRALLRFWRDSGAFARIASVAALVAVSVYGGSKSGGTNGLGGAGTFMVPRPLAGPGIAQSHSSGTSSDPTNGLRFTSFAMDGDRFDFSVAWPATNSSEWSAIDVFHKRELVDQAWRWIHRETVWPENGEAEFILSGDDLPYWEEKVSR